MKKLLALVLCVMMFVSVLSTSAFAAYDPTDQRVWKGADQSKDIVDALRKNIENMYGSIAVDNAAVSTMKSINTLVNDMVDEMMKGYTPTGAGTGLSSSTLSDAIKLGLRQTIGGSISNYLDEHSYQYIDFDSHGNAVFNPIKYASVFSKAASEAVSSKKAVAGIQAFMTYVLQRATYESVAQQLGLLMSDLPSWWGDYGFDKNLNVPGVAINNVDNIDGILHHVNHTYQEFLSALGQVGVDLDANGVLSVGVPGWVWTVDGVLVPTDAKQTENANTPLAAPLFADIDGDGDLEMTAIVYEGTTGEYWIDTDGDGVVDDIDDTGAVYGLNDQNGNPTAYFIWTHLDDLVSGVPGEAANEADVGGLYSIARDEDIAQILDILNGDVLDLVTGGTAATH
jgi:hypothetical protein